MHMDPKFSTLHAETLSITVLLSCPGQWPLHPSRASDGHEGPVGTSIASVASEAGNIHAHVHVHMGPMYTRYLKCSAEEFRRLLYVHAQ